MKIVLPDYWFCIFFLNHLTCSWRGLDIIPAQPQSSSIKT